MAKLDLQPEYLRLSLDIFESHLPAAEVWAYGSRVNGGSHDGSDLDLVVCNPANPDQPQQRLSELRAALSESDLPILVDVSDWARLPESFRQEIERQHVVIRGAMASENKPTPTIRS
jgi:predicted nucleotidyltransferase